MTAPTELDERALEAACAATVLGEDADGKPVHLEPQEAATAIRAYLSALPASGAGWRPIAEAPKDGRLFIAWGAGDVPYVTSHLSADTFAHLGGHPKPVPTHWMPLPSPPLPAIGDRARNAPTP